MEVQELEHDYLSVVRNSKQLIITCLLIWVSLTQSLEVKRKICICWNSSLPMCSLSAGKAFCSFPSVWKGLCVPLLKQVLHSLLTQLSTCCFIETFLISRLYYLARFLGEDSMNPHAPINEIPDTDFA